MESAIVPSSAYSRREPLSFLDLPTEMRLMIYGYLYEEITISSSCTRDPISWPTRSRVGSYDSPRIDLLLTCPQVYMEARTVLDAAPIAIEGDHRGSLSPHKFPLHVSQRVHRMTNECNHFYVPYHPHGLNLDDPNVCPNCRLIWVEGSWAGGICNVYFPVSCGLLQPLLSHLPKPKSVQVVSPALSSHPTPDILQLFKSNPSSSRWLGAVSRTDAFFKKRDITMKTNYNFGIRGLERTYGSYVSLGKYPSRTPTERLIFEEWYEAVLVWDKNGVRFEELPDLRKGPWWAKWVDRDDFEILPAQSNDYRVEIQISKKFFLRAEGFRTWMLLGEVKTSASDHMKKVSN